MILLCFINLFVYLCAATVDVTTNSQNVSVDYQNATIAEDVFMIIDEGATENVTIDDEYYCGNKTQLSGYWMTDDPYEVLNISCTVKFEEFYKIKLTIEIFELNPTTVYYQVRKDRFQFQDFLQITPNETADSNGKGILLLGYVNKTSYVVPSNGISMKLFAYPHPENNTYRGFKIKWERFGELPTTTVPTTTTEMIPTPPENESGMYTSYIFGPEPNETLKNLTVFKKLLALKARNYCKDMNMELEEDIKENNVKVVKITKCSILWPDSDKCTEIYFELPIVLKNSSEYQLISKHLKNIWNRISNSELPEGWSKYEVPDNGRNFAYWLIASCVIVMLFFVFLFLVRYVQLTFVYEDGKTQILDNYQSTPRQSDINWPNQVTPPLFDNTDDYQYRNVKSSYINPTFIDDEFSEEEIMNVHNFKQHNDNNFESFNEYFKNKNK